MRFSPIKFLHGLLYAAPVVLLTLAACGGGGGGSTPPAVPLASAYTVGGAITGLTSTSGGLVLRNNGGDDLVVASGVVSSYTFATAVANGGSYNVTVLTNPNSPTQLCTVANASGTIGSANVTNANVTCTNAWTIGGTIRGDSAIAVSGIGPILHNNNNGEDLFIPILPASGAPMSFTFSTPVANGAPFTVTQLSRAKSPGQDCSNITPVSGVASSGSYAVVAITCVAASITSKYAYVTNSTDNTISAYTIAASGVLSTTGTPQPTGSQPYSVSVDPTGRFAYVANLSSNNISAYKIDTGPTTPGALIAIDANGAISGTQYTIATGPAPASVTVDPSGKFVYVVNQTNNTTGNSISAYSINTTTGALSAIDANGAVSGTQASIATGTSPYAVTVDPTGKFAYVANGNSNNVSVYTINQTSGALTAGTAVSAGTTPISVAIDPTGQYAFVANNGSNNVSTYSINPTTGALSPVGGPYGAGSAPRSVAIDPTGQFVYVANAGGGNVSAYTNANGVLTPVTGSPFAAGANPFSVNVDPSGQFVYVANFGNPYGVSTYTIGIGGALTPVGSAATTGTGPTSVTTTQ
jgi:6-phosphogluconolactonase